MGVLRTIALPRFSRSGIRLRMPIGFRDRVRNDAPARHARMLVAELSIVLADTVTPNTIDAAVYSRTLRAPSRGDGGQQGGASADRQVPLALAVKAGRLTGQIRHESS
jgi:hypothetical protein